MIACLVLPAFHAAAQDSFRTQVRALIEASAEEHRIAMTCSKRGSADYYRALDNWEKRFGASLRRLQHSAGYSENDILDLRVDFGPAAIFPSALYSQSELDAYCETQKAMYRRFVDGHMIPLHARIGRLIRKRKQGE